jgi:hypothetical protein
MVIVIIILVGVWVGVIVWVDRCNSMGRCKGRCNSMGRCKGRCNSMGRCKGRCNSMGRCNGMGR